MKPRVALIGHIPALPNTIDLPQDRERAEQYLQLHNFTRVLTEDRKLVDHIAHLKRERGLDRKTPFSVWEMWLCAPLLLASHLRRNGFEVLVVNYIDDDNRDAEFGRLSSFAPNIVLLSTTFVLSRRHLTTMSRQVRARCPEAFIVAGGHHVFTTLMYMTEQQRAAYLLSAGLDAFVNDTQGEGAVLELCRRFPDELHDVPNLIWRDRGGAVVHNRRVVEQNNINETLIDFDDIAEGANVHIRTARSCSFKCAFCSYPTIAGELALMDVENALSTLRKCKDRGVGSVFFVDDTFNVPKERFVALLDGIIERGLAIPWYSFLRCQYVDKDIVAKMRKAGCQGVFLGVESGSDTILKKMKKGAIINFYRDGLKWLGDNGITTVGSFIVGYPGETDQTVEETATFIDSSGLDYYFMQPFYYLHHTPIHKNAEKYGLTGEGLCWSHDTMEWRQALAHVGRLFKGINGSTFVNPDYTLWELAYLRSKGLSIGEIKDYRANINRMTVEQMKRFALLEASPTSRDAISVTQNHSPDSRRKRLPVADPS